MAAAAFLAATLVRTLPPIATPCDASAIFLATTAVFTLAPMMTGARTTLAPMAAALAPSANLVTRIPFPMAAPLIAPAMAPVNKGTVS